MSHLLFESPVTVGVIGGIVTLSAILVWIKAGKSIALYASAICLLLTLLLVWLSLQITTDREQINDVMQRVAQAVENNDLPGVLEHVYPSSSAGIERAKTEFPSYKFTEARITSVKSLDIDPRTNPPSATAEIFVAVSLSANGNQVNGIRRFVRVYLLKEGEQWRVSDYAHYPVGDGFRALPVDP